MQTQRMDCWGIQGLHLVIPLNRGGWGGGVRLLPRKGEKSMRRLLMRGKDRRDWGRWSWGGVWVVLIDISLGCTLVVLSGARNCAMLIPSNTRRYVFLHMFETQVRYRWVYVIARFADTIVAHVNRVAIANVYLLHVLHLHSWWEPIPTDRFAFESPKEKANIDISPIILDTIFIFYLTSKHCHW